MRKISFSLHGVGGKIPTSKGRELVHLEQGKGCMSGHRFASGEKADGLAALSDSKDGHDRDWR